VVAVERAEIEVTEQPLEHTGTAATTDRSLDQLPEHLADRFLSRREPDCVADAIQPPRRVGAIERRATQRLVQLAQELKEPLPVPASQLDKLQPKFAGEDAQVFHRDAEPPEILVDLVGVTAVPGGRQALRQVPLNRSFHPGQL